MVFERQPPSPEVCICSENIVNNSVLARGPLTPIWCKLAPKRLPKGGLGPHFGGPGPSRRPRQRENGGSEKLSEHLRKKTCFHGRAGSEMGDGLSWGGESWPWVLATFSPWMTFSPRRNALPANFADAPPVRMVTFSDSSWGKSRQ